MYPGIVKESYYFNHFLPTMSKHIPKYRLFKARNKGFVEVNSKRQYLPGKYNSPESLKAYADFIKKLLSENCDPENQFVVNESITVEILCVQFLDWAKSYYIKHGQPTGMYKRFQKCVVPPLLDMYGKTPVSKFGPRALKHIRNKLINKNLCRTEINQRIKYIKQMFSWGVENELVTPETAGALRYVKSLRKEEQNVRESVPMSAVPNEYVDAVLPYLPEPIADMVRINKAVGCRPSEVCHLRWIDINKSEEEDIWIYTPWKYKTEHRKKQRHIPLLPEVQHILERYKHRPVNEYIFSPRETLKLFSKKKKRKDDYRFHDCYTISGYANAIKRACKRANIPSWAPYQLRHTFATNTRTLVGIEVAQLLLGHAQISTTELYAEKTFEAIKAVAKTLLKTKKEENY